MKQNPMYSIAVGVANGLYGQRVIYCLHDGHFYLYTTGYWKECFDIELLSQICSHTTVKDECNIDFYPASTKNQILDSLKMLVHKPLSAFNVNGYLNFENGLLDVTGEGFLDHNPDTITTIRLPYQYKPTAQCPLWLKIISEIFEEVEDKTNILQEFFGYCLTRDTSQIKALLLLGDSKSGKSTILHVLRHMVGISNCSSVPMKFISNPQYTPLLINRLINIDADVSEKAQDFEFEFKIITSGEPVNCNQKFVPTFEFVPYCKIVMAANTFPRITDHSSAFYNRLIIIPCERVFLPNEQDRTLKKRLLEELPGILQWALIGLARLNKRGMFEENDFIAKALQDLRDESNPVDVFFREVIETDVTGNKWIEKEDLYKKYCQWCQQGGNAPMSMIRFNRAVYQKYSKFTPKDTKGDSHKRVWRNLKYKNEIIQKGENISWQE